MHESDKTLASKHVGPYDLKSNVAKICFGGDARCKQVRNMLKNYIKPACRFTMACVQV